MKRKPVVIIGGVAILIAAWFVAAHFFGPNSQRGINQTIERLQQDSIALQSDFRPLGQYTDYRDIDDAITNIKDLGDPLRFGHTDTDSIRLFGTPQTARIANYNIAKCDSVLCEVLPLWRSKLVFVIEKQIDPHAEIIRISGNNTGNPKVELYTLRYLDTKEIENDALKYNGVFKNAGFKAAIYAPAPNSDGKEYTFTK